MHASFADFRSRDEIPCFFLVESVVSGRNAETTVIETDIAVTWPHSGSRNFLLEEEEERE